MAPDGPEGSEQFMGPPTFGSVPSMMPEASHVDQEWLRKSRFQCKLCSYTSARGYNLKRHIYRVHKMQPPGLFTMKEYICRHCGFDSVVLDLYQRHMKTKHPEEILTCQPCREVFYDQEHFSEHLRNIHYVEENAT